MSNSKCFQPPDGTVAFAAVRVDPKTGLPLPNADINSFVKIVGRCSALQNVLREVWDGPTDRYVPPAAPIQMQVVSSSANDTAAGTGARSVRIYYLDTNYVAHDETVILNGTTPVLTAATNILRVNKMHVKTVGSSGVSAGNISLQAVGGAVTYSYMIAGRNLARQAIYTVPDGFRLRLEQWQLSSGSTGNHFCQHTLAATSDDGELSTVLLPKDEQGSQNGGLVIGYEFVIEDLPPRADVRVVAIADQANANVIALTAIFGRLYPVTP